MVYVDTSVLIALILNEPKSTEVLNWYESCKEELVSAVWCVTEFSSALGIKQRTQQITESQAQKAWEAFDHLCSNDLNLLPLEPKIFFKAAELALKYQSALRAGDSLHLSAALATPSKKIATLDEVMAKNAKALKFRLSL